MQAIFWVMMFMALPFVLTPLLRAKLQGTPAFLIVALPAFATLVYLSIGSPDVESATPHASVTQTGNRDAASQIGSDSDLTAGLAGSVSLSAAAAKLVEPGDTVFIFARPPGQGGAPVAVVRETAESWPLKFRLTDTQSMTTGTRLTDHEQVVVTARISRRGDADPALRALEAKSPPIDVASNTPLRLTIE